MTRIARQETGAALVMVLMGILILAAVGAFAMLAVDRNTDLRFAYQKNVAGLGAAEAGLNVGAAAVLNVMQDFGLPADCRPQTVLVNGRTVTYTLSVPGGTVGSCAETPLNVPEPAGPFAGLNAIVYRYNLTSSAMNAQGFTEATLSNQFLANLIPVFQFAAFYKDDLEYLPGPPLVVNGRLHTNGDMYLNSDSCGSPTSAGMNILGRITIVGSGISGTAPLNRGRKDSNVNHDNVYISRDGTSSNMQVLGTNAAGSPSCAGVGTRKIPQSEINTWNGRISTGLTNINLPTTSGLLCTPWLAGCPAVGGAYWQHAAVRIVLDRSAAPSKLVSTPGAPGPPLYPVKVLYADGNLDSAKTDALTSFMTDASNGVGAITYSDVPKPATNWDCRAYADCESSTYGAGVQYTPAFPQTGSNGCTAPRGPRQVITGGPSGNYCNDYRFGGFYNWRESKPILTLNIDWIALSKWNRDHANVLFDPNVTTNGGPVVFVSVRGPNSSGANDYGVRIFDAARLPRDTTNTGVTFASDQAMYIVGNFNCPAPDMSGGDTVPAACGDAERPSSVVADTVNVHSCAWIQAAACGTFVTGDQWAGVGMLRPLDEHSTNQSAACGSGCAAAQTVMNVAFLAGNDRTWCKPVTGNDTGLNCGDSSWYSGGLENYPRFHEDWQPGSGIQKFWYQGSFVALDVPHHTCYVFRTQLVPTTNDPNYSCGAYPKQGFWSTQRYVPPARRWFYHVGYNDAASLPPLTPRFVYLKQIYFTEVFQ